MSFISDLLVEQHNDKRSGFQLLEPLLGKESQALTASDIISLSLGRYPVSLLRLSTAAEV